MRKLVIIFLISISGVSFAQSHPNSWIDYPKVYYKFTLGQTGLYRISQATLNSVGLGKVPAEQFQCGRNGAEAPLDTSVPTGPLGVSDYIELWGRMNYGKIANLSSRKLAYQLSPQYSLETDTA